MSSDEESDSSAVPTERTERTGRMGNIQRMGSITSARGGMLGRNMSVKKMNLLETNPLVTVMGAKLMRLKSVIKSEPLLESIIQRKNSDGTLVTTDEDPPKSLENGSVDETSLALSSGRQPAGSSSVIATGRSSTPGSARGDLKSGRNSARGLGSARGSSKQLVDDSLHWIVVDKEDRRRINDKLLITSHPLEIARLNIFIPRATMEFIPDQAPETDPICLAGSTYRRPFRAWFKCTDAEKEMELRVACMMDYIVELAVEDGQCCGIPDDEDFALGQTGVDVFQRTNRIKAFTAWYCGDELVNKNRDKGVPSLARVLVSELFERRAILEDPSVAAYMEKNMGHAAVHGSESKRKDKHRHKHGQKAVEVISESPTADTDDDAYDHVRKTTLYKSKLITVYERSLTTSSGTDGRIELYRRYVDVMSCCRQYSMTRLLYPPGPQKSSSRIMLPRLGVLVPPYEVPPIRYSLYPSLNNSAYSEEEMLLWYTPEQLDEDDLAMLKAEELGQKLRAYSEWLANTAARVAQGRLGR